MNRNHTWRAVATSAAVAGSCLMAPAGAFAAFSDTRSEAPHYSALRITAPAAADVHMTCSTFGLKATVVVNSFDQVPRTNYHEIKLYNRSGALEFTGDLSKSSGRTYTSGIQLVGTWTYEIHLYNKVPGTSNAWKGAALTGALTC